MSHGSRSCEGNTGTPALIPAQAVPSAAEGLAPNLEETCSHSKAGCMHCNGFRKEGAAFKSAFKPCSNSINHEAKCDPAH